MRSEDADLVAQKHHSVGQTPPWQGFLRRLVTRVGAASASVIIASPDQPAQTYAYPDAAQNPTSEQLQRMRFLRVYSAEDFPNPYPFRAMRFRLQGGESAWIFVQKEGADFAASTSALLTLMGDNLAVACQTYIRLQGDRAVAIQMQDMAARLGLAWMVVERQGGGIAIAAQSGALPESLVAAGRIKLPAPLQQDLMVGLASGAFDPIPCQHLGLQLLALPAGPGRAVIYVQAAPKSMAATAPMIAALTGLTPAEARFVQKMAQGMTIAEAGTALGLSPESARYYSKQAYAKLGLPHQTALVRLLQTSVLRLV